MSDKIRAQATSATLCRASTGTEQVAVSFKYLETVGPFEKGDSITWYGFLTDSTFDRTVESLRNAGWSGNNLADLSTVRGVVVLVLEEDEYNGRVRTKVKWVNRISDGPAVKTENRIEGTQAAALAKRLEKRVIASDAARAKAAAGGGNPLD